MDTDEKPVGVLVFGDVALCTSCAQDLAFMGAPLYARHILPYRQTCARCEITMVEPHTAVELFIGKLSDHLSAQ